MGQWSQQQFDAANSYGDFLAVYAIKDNIVHCYKMFRRKGKYFYDVRKKISFENTGFSDVPPEIGDVIHMATDGTVCLFKIDQFNKTVQ